MAHLLNGGHRTQHGANVGGRGPSSAMFSGSPIVVSAARQCTLHTPELSEYPERFSARPFAMAGVARRGAEWRAREALGMATSHCSNDGEDTIVNRGGKSGPCVDYTGQLWVGRRGFWRKCCALCCALWRSGGFLGVFGGIQLISNPLVAGSSPAGRACKSFPRKHLHRNRKMALSPSQLDFTKFHKLAPATSGISVGVTRPSCPVGQPTVGRSRQQSSSPGS